MRSPSPHRRFTAYATRAAASKPETFQTVEACACASVEEKGGGGDDDGDDGDDDKKPGLSTSCILHVCFHFQILYT